MVRKVRRSGMSDQLEKKHCSLYYTLSQHLSAEPRKTINTSVRITSLRVDIRTPDLSITNPYTTVQRRVFIARSKNSRFRTNDLLHTLFDVFWEASQRPATEDNTVGCFVFGVRTGWFVRMYILSLFEACRQTSRALPCMFPRGRHWLVSTRNSCSSPNRLYNQIHYYFVILLVNNLSLNTSSKISAVI